ncbi:MAG: hypothetical protein JSR54_11635 [Proteobacteria bacterium]|nr:hypothetical protein [Pseudomonadota bacterium]
MDRRPPLEPPDWHRLPDEEIERLELLALASQAMIAHAEHLAELERAAQADRRAA